ncbi:MAG: hypothetical protein DRP57_04295 [Spirochaetes bacterium]|nr:MAG: hypothetical protein DRP57_04295 [Spirochaetota bacterium]
MNNSQLLNTSPSAIQLIYEKTCIDIIKDISKDLLQATETTGTFASTYGVDKTVHEIEFSEQIKELYKTYHSPDAAKMENETVSSNIADSIRDDLEISKVGNFDISIEDALEMVGNLKRDIGTKFYGVLLSTEGITKSRTIINPLHPIIASNILESDIDTTEKSWSVAIYSWKDNAGIFERFPYLTNGKDYIPEIVSVLASIKKPSIYVTENSNFSVEMSNGAFVLAYEEVKKKKNSGEVVSSGEGVHYIVPGQIINVSGIAYPYYGVIYSTGGRAWNLCPMHGANIDHPAHAPRNTIENGSKICTSSGEVNTKIGISSLNHCNVTSPLNTYILREGAMAYASQCMDTSIELLLGEEYSVKRPKKTLTFQEFKEENGGRGTKLQFIEYIKSRLDSTPKDSEPPEEEEAEEVVEAELDYPTVNPGIEYVEGDIVYGIKLDGIRVNQLIIRKNDKWEKYNPEEESDLISLDTVPPHTNGSPIMDILPIDLNSITTDTFPIENTEGTT